MNQAVDNIRRLTFFEWRQLLLAVFLLPTVALLLSWRGYQKTFSTLEQWGSRQSRENDDHDCLARIPRMVSVAARYGPYRANCLRQALVTWWLLRRQGFDAEICFGVQNKTPESLDAHAWVEYNGINLSDSEQAQKNIVALR